MIREFFGKVKSAVESAFEDRRKARPRAVAALHPSLRRRIERALGRRMEGNALVMVSRADEAAYAAAAEDTAARVAARAAWRAARRVTGGLSGNAHQRRIARRAALRAA
jgi:hypothetical protein